ncbi:MAG: hypothetical protein JWL66_2106 [Sphingomonadales bacterium]|nr:hypothetical protein [Sphingomonadales bacterium]
MSGKTWESLIDELRPLGGMMHDRVPEELRGDPHVMQESVRLLLYGLMRATTDALVGDRDHPMFVPELNIAQNIFQPNADTIYKTAMIAPGGSYRLRGDRGTVRMVILAQMGPDTLRSGQHHPVLGQLDFNDLTLDAKGMFDVLISPEKPQDHAGDWVLLNPQTEKFMVRIVGCDWGHEREPRLSIDRLDVQPAKGRVSLDDLAFRLSEIPTITRNCALAFPAKVQQLRDEGLVNALKVVDFSQMSGLSRQSYYEGAYDLADDEALITEVHIPAQVGYWSLILTNELYETTDWYNNQSSLNDTQAVVDSDGVFRAVISARDPGVHNWIDTSGYPRGAVQGRWFDTDARPTPTIRKVKLGEVKALLPADTTRVTPGQRDAMLRDRRMAAQLRTIW